MTWTLWLLVAVIAAAFWGLGCLSARARTINAGQRAARAGGGPETARKAAGRLISDRHANAILAIFFTTIALSVAVDTIYLQVRVNRYMNAQVDCNTRLLATDVVVSKARKNVDQAALTYDLAMTEYLRDATTQSVIPATDHAYLAVQDRLQKLEDARLAMIGVYAGNPWPPNCPTTSG